MLLSDWQDVRWMHVHGYGYCFDGDSFDTRHVTRKIKEYKGTQPASCLSAMELNAEIEAELKSKTSVLQCLQCG
jgi:hypothetical protein